MKGPGSLGPLQPMLAAIAQTAARLCDASDALILLAEGDQARLVARHGRLRTIGRLGGVSPLTDDLASHRAIVERRTIHVRALAKTSPGRTVGVRTALATPLLRDGVAIGSIVIRRPKVRPFTPTQIALLKTFADQAAIAIENTRLFRDLTEALEQQTATSEILRVIAASPTDLQPVLDAIAENAARVCGATDGVVHLVEGGELPLVAHYGLIGAQITPVGRRFPLNRDSVVGRTVIDGQTVHVEDIGATDEAEFRLGKEIARQTGQRTVLGTPLVREGVVIGGLVIRRLEVRPFTDKQIALLKTFADQAVIAIENVRLFKELEVRNRDLTLAHAQVTEALEQQTATAEILRVISGSPTDVQPVMRALVEAAKRLTDADRALIGEMAGDSLYWLASDGGPAPSGTPIPISRALPTGRAILDRRTTQEADIHMLAIQFPHIADLQYTRTALATPLLREGVAVGVLLVSRREVRPFTDKQIELLKTFADQAVIAIENVRLFKELQARTGELTQSVEKLTALGEVSQALSSTLDVETVLTTIVSRAVQLSGLDGGVVFEYDEAAEEFVHRAATETGGTLAEVRRSTRVQKGEGVVGQTAITLEPVQVPDIAMPGAYDSRLRENLIESGVRAIVAVPMVREDRLIGCLVVSHNRPGEFPAETIDLLRTFATQSALAIQNARLFQEIADKSAQLEAASRHKSEFLANMSHELRTPLNAIIGFSEVLVDRMFGELNEKQDEYLKDIYASGQHLLSLINDILDLSKIEAGRMEVELTDFDLPSAIDNALLLVRERASRRGITLGQSVDERLGTIRGDERKVKQVLLNLLSNALKFTPEGGRIDVSARAHDGVAEVSVADTGVGIAPEDQEAVFEEFRQVGTADKKVEGTGLGLALSRKFIELHGGRIWVKSQVGHGSTFTFTLPVHREE